MSRELNRHFRQDYDRFVFDGVDKVNGKPCYKVTMTNVAGMSMTLWIDKSRYLILRAYDGFVGSNILYAIKKAG